MKLIFFVIITGDGLVWFGLVPASQEERRLFVCWQVHHRGGTRGERWRMSTERDTFEQSACQTSMLVRSQLKMVQAALLLITINLFIQATLVIAQMNELIQVATIVPHVLQVR